LGHVEGQHLGIAGAGDRGAESEGPAGGRRQVGGHEDPAERKGRAVLRLPYAHGCAAVPDDRLGDAAQKQMAEPLAAVRGHDDQIGAGAPHASEQGTGD